MASLVSRILSREERALTASEAIRRMIQSTTTRAGVAVNEQSALQLMSVFTAVRILSETFAQVPLKIYRMGPDGARSEARTHPLWKILHDQPNDEMTSFTLREVMLGHLLTWGNCYLEISRNFNGDVIGLWPLLPNRTRPARDKDGALIYITRVSKDPAGVQHLEEVRLPANNVLAIPGLGFDGMQGYSVISMVREGLGLAMAYEAFGSYFFGNNAIPGFVLSTEQQLKEETVKSLEFRIKEQHEGLTNAQRLMILTGGLKPERIGISPEDSQFIQSKKFSRSEILGLYRVPPHMAGDPVPSSWGTGIEQMAIGFVTFTMVPWFKRVEQAINMKLFGANAQAPIFPEFEVDSLTRGDFKTRQEAYAIGRQWGWISVNDIKRKENDPVIGEKGDIYLTPLNMQPAEDALLEPPVAPRGMPGTGVDVGVEAGGAAPATTTKAAAARPIETRPIGPYEDWAACISDQLEKGHPQAVAEKICGALENKSGSGAAEFRRAFAGGQSHAVIDLIERALRRERADVVRGVEKTLKAGADLPAWIGAFYAEHRKWFVAQATPAITSLAESVRADVARETGQQVQRAPVLRFAHAFVDGMSERIISESEGLMRAALTARPEAQQVATVVDRRAETIGRREALRAVNAVASVCYRELGLSARWVAGDLCAACAALDGQIAGPGEPFSEIAGRALNHPPACDDCTCVIATENSSAPEISSRAMVVPKSPTALEQTLDGAFGVLRAAVQREESVNELDRSEIRSLGREMAEFRRAFLRAMTEPPKLSIEPGAIVMTVNPQTITVEAAPTPTVNVTTAPVNVTIEAPAGESVTEIKRDKQGNVIEFKKTNG